MQPQGGDPIPAQGIAGNAGGALGHEQKKMDEPQRGDPISVVVAKIMGRPFRAFAIN